MMRLIRQLRAWHLATACFIVVLTLLFNQFLTSGGTWFKWEEFFHHESFIVAIALLGIGFLVGSRLRK